jgi:D-alanyl-D-alanine carboxypeptidase
MKFWQATGPIVGDRNIAVQPAQPAIGWILLALVVLACSARPAVAFRAHSPRIVHAGILIDAKTGQVLEAWHPQRRAHPASLTKLMTLYLTFRSLENGRINLDTPLHVSRHAAAQQPTRLWLQPGTTITVRDAILGIITRSANDAAVVLGEYLGGSESRFAAIMTREARHLGMTRTRFYNASGLPDARQWTTARDMATLAIALIHTFPQYYHFFGVHSFSFQGRIIYGHDHLLDECDGVDGMKTGYVRASGFNIVTSAIREHRRLVGVVLGGASVVSRDRQMVALMNQGFGMSPVPRTLVAAAANSDEPGASPTAAKLLSTSAEDASTADTRDSTIEAGGNFPTQHAVRRILHSARRSAPSFLRHGRSLVVLLHGHHYRARFSDLTHEEAYQACSALERRKFTCRVLTHSPSPTQDLASAAASSSSQSD